MDALRTLFPVLVLVTCLTGHQSGAFLIGRGIADITGLVAEGLLVRFRSFVPPSITDHGLWLDKEMKTLNLTLGTTDAKQSS